MLMAFLLVVLLSSAALAQTVYDFGGKTVKIQHNLTYDRLIAEDPEKLAWLEQIESMFNVKLEWTSGGRDEAEVPILAAAVMSGDAPDLIRIRQWTVSMAALQGLLRPIDEVVDDEFRQRIPAWKTNELDSYSKVNNHYYAFGADGPQGTGIWWNKRIFEQEGLESPWELYVAGEWDWDAMREAAIKATRDTNGDGEIDQWGLTDYDNYDRYFPVWVLASNNAVSFRLDENGNPQFAFDEPEAMAAFEYLYDLFQVSKVMSPTRRASFWQGNVAMMAERPWGARHAAENNMEDDYSFVPFPKGPHATEHQAVFNHANVWAIPVTSQFDTRALIELMFAIDKMTPEWMDVDPDVAKEEWINSFFVMNARDYESVETFLWVIENSWVYNYIDSAYMPGFVTAIRRIINDGEQPASVIASWKPEAQAHLDQVFGVSK